MNMLIIALLILVAVGLFLYFKQSGSGGTITEEENYRVETIVPMPPIFTHPGLPGTVADSAAKDFSNSGLPSNLTIRASDPSILKIFKSHILKSSDEKTIFSSPFIEYYYPENVTSSGSVHLSGSNGDLEVIVGSLLENNVLRVNLYIYGVSTGTPLKFKVDSNLHKKESIYSFVVTNTRTSYISLDFTPVVNEITDEVFTLLLPTKDIIIPVGEEFYIYSSYTMYNKTSAEVNLPPWIKDHYCR